MTINSASVPTSLPDRPAVKEHAYLVDAGYLATLLKFGSEGRAAQDVVRDAVHRFGVLRRLIASELARVAPRCSQHAAGRDAFAQIQTAIRRARRLLPEDPGIGPRAETNPSLTVLLGELEQDIFGCLYLDRRIGPPRFEAAGLSTPQATGVRVREAMQRARLPVACVTSWTSCERRAP